MADVYKLLGNSCYGKLIKAIERQTKVIFTKNKDQVDRSLWSAWFKELQKSVTWMDRPFQVGIAVYQQANLCILEFLECYFMESLELKKTKISSKGLSKRQNNLNWERWPASWTKRPTGGFR